jgi:membrane associated rhomboid family serine protease
MHILGHPRNVAVVGIVFVVIGFIYWLVPYIDAPAFTDYAGTVMLGALGIAMAVMAYVLVAGSPRD